MKDLKMQRFMNKIGYTFQQPALLQQALTHRSVSAIHNYERLEFLGDALLGTIIAHYLYRHFAEQKEGQLTRMRATLVRQDALVKIAKDLGIGQMMILSMGELKSGGHHRESILADMVEAMIGAMYLDNGEFASIERIVLNWYRPYLQDITPGEQLKDPKSRLQELLQAKHQPLPIYEVIEIKGDAPHQYFTVRCTVEGMPSLTGGGSSRRFAEQAVAADLLKMME